ncbi:CAP-Gly domain-containing linker protein 2-like [Uranotaenia lowii]|uniref:CAP-Gly domain-containing linker protein 2-like n=1 Tax=Uranotaenia lowii TaxID=190385 RepID=UPI00247A7480|nr:CAP-Gly domain-containing linker protein 2-like [Uranotaenia lowii]
MINEEDEGINQDEENVEEERVEHQQDVENFNNQEEAAESEHQGDATEKKEETVDELNNSSKLYPETDVMEVSFSTSNTKHENIPDWVVVGESVQIRPYNTSGVISFIGDTHFQGGTWIGVELDTPTGKNDGTVQGIQYFNCKPKHGIFVRVDKLILDKRGRAIRELKKAEKMKAELAGKTGQQKPISANGPRK